MKPRYFFRKITFIAYTPLHAKVKKLWNRLKDKDCVLMVTKENYWRKMIVVYDINKIICFAKDNRTNLVYATDNQKDIKIHMQSEKVFVDKEKLLVWDI